MRHLVVCCDGTWNRADQVQDGVPTPTNVRLFHNLLGPTARDGQAQLKQYFSGVGADGSKMSRMFDGGTGHGLKRNIMNAYLWLARNYQEGDLISAVGFSRGAYTVRSLVGMVTSCGLATVPRAGMDPVGSWRIVERVFERGYARRGDGVYGDWRDGITFFDGFHPPSDKGDPAELGRRVEFLGVWDTVGSLGVPDTMGFLNLFDDHEEYAFHDTHLNPGVRCARHAVALDERRGPFAPTLWTTRAGEALQEPARVVQRWFPGVHSDVGGGYREHGLSDGALRWMVDEAKAHTALQFIKQASRIRGDAFDVLHDSCVGPYSFLSPVPRSVPRVIEGAEHVDQSAIDRFENPPVRQDAYRRGGAPAVGTSRTVPVFAHEPWCETGLYLETGMYRVSAAGEWFDSDLGADADGEDGKGFLTHVRYRVGDLCDGVETVWQEVLSNPDAVVPFSKRVPDAGWMQLVLAIANGAFDGAGRPLLPQIEAVGRGPVEVEVRVPGYLYAFANDSWGMYSNNRGAVDLTVQRIT
jgi:hypothetical protein